MRKILENCPACGGDIIVTQIGCTECECTVNGRFQPTIFNRLSPESLAFVETFVRLRGNIKDMERELGIPYSTIRNRLDDVIAELGFTPGLAPEPNVLEAPIASAVKRRDILDALEAGDITANEAATELSKLKQEQKT